MKIPRLRLSFSESDLARLTPTLELLANRLASAKLGAFPFRHAFDRIDTKLSAVFNDRAYDALMSERIIATRAKLKTIPSGKVRLDIFEIAIAAFALRVSRSTASWQTGDKSEVSHCSLARKLEIYRMRAKRLTVSKLGEETYKVQAATWTRFMKWMRYSLLQNNIPKIQSFDRKPLWAAQRLALASMIQTALEERCYAGLAEDQLLRISKLVKDSIQRGRQTMTLRELLLADRKGRDLLFSFVESRMDLTALPGAVIPAWKKASQAADKFNEFQELQRQKRLSKP